MPLQSHAYRGDGGWAANDNGGYKHSIVVPVHILPPAHTNPLCVTTRTLKSPPITQTTGLNSSSSRFMLYMPLLVYLRLPLGICTWEGSSDLGSFDLHSTVSVNPFRPSVPIPLHSFIHSFIQVRIYSEQPDRKYLPHDIKEER
jgi:hypothetical protein